MDSESASGRCAGGDAMLARVGAEACATSRRHASQSGATMVDQRRCTCVVSGD